MATLKAVTEEAVEAADSGGTEADNLIQLALSTMDESILLKRAARLSAQKVSRGLSHADFSAKRSSSRK